MRRYPDPNANVGVEFISTQWDSTRFVGIYVDVGELEVIGESLTNAS